MKLFFALILFFVAGVVFSQEKELEEVSKLIENKKYNSAFLLLEKLDPNNQIPKIAIKKTKLLLDYFVSSMMHQMFALKDLDANEELQEIRGTEGIFSMYYFPPDSVLNLLIQKNPENYKLRKTLGYFYYEIYLKYPGSWLEPDSVVFRKIIENNELAYKNGEYDYWSSYGIGTAYLNLGEVQKSIPYLIKSIELNASYVSSYYNLAYAYLSVNEAEIAVEYALKAYEQYKYFEYKSDAAKMLGIIYTDLNDDQNAIKYLLEANALTPNNYYVLKPLLELEVKTEADNYAERTNEFFMLSPDSPTIYEDIEEIYLTNNKGNELLQFLENQKNNFSDNHNVLGNLHFYIARIYAGKENTEAAKQNFKKAAEEFKKVFQPSHEVFKIIDTYLKEN